jgi:hypothetical protein
MKQATVWTIIPMLMLLASGCTLKSTIKQTTDTTSNITGTTSGHAWWSEDGLLVPEHKAMAFTKYNEANLEQDLARGQGEYVSSLATLLGVPRDQQPSFHAKAQVEFDVLTISDHKTQLHRLRTLAHGQLAGH